MRTDTQQEYQDLFDIYVAIGVGVLVLIWVAILVAVLRFRRRRHHGEDLPPDVHSNKLAEVSWVGALSLVTAALVFLTFTTISEIREGQPEPASAVAPPGSPASRGDPDLEADLRVRATASRWNWRFEYPEQGIVQLGGPETIPTLVVPVGTVLFDLTSTDVIHAFFIPSQRFKRDAFPGRVTRFALGFDEPGLYRDGGECAEFCGLRHAYMQFDVQVVEPAEFERWAQRRAAGAPQRVRPTLDRRQDR